MKTLLRSTFIASPSDNKDLFIRNFLKLNDSGLEFDQALDNLIWDFIKTFVASHNHVPDVASIKSNFAQKNEPTVLDRLSAIENLPSYTQGDFETRLAAKIEDKRTRDVLDLLKDASVVLTTGLEVSHGHKKEILKGPVAAVHYVLDRSHDVVTPTSGVRLTGEVTSDGEDFKHTYEKIERDPLSGIGQHTGLTQIDTVINGAKKQELWIHAGAPGGMKSTWIMNWAYNQAVYFLHSSILFSLEMYYKQDRNVLYALHTAHPKFRLIRYWLGLQKDPYGTVGLPYSFIRDALLANWNPNAKRFLFDYVVPDFNREHVDVDHHPDTGEPYIDPQTGQQMLCSIDENGEPYPSSKDYGKVFIEVADPAKKDFTIDDMSNKAELIYSRDPFSMIFVDHVGLVSARHWSSSVTDRQNEVIKDLKKMSQSFNRGQGMAVVGLFQINREGQRMVQKQKEKSGTAKYEYYHLSYANECEKSADIITASWMDDDLSKANRVQFQCLKSRDQKPFEPFLARIEWPCKRILTCFEVPLTVDQKTSVGNRMDHAADLLNT